MTPQGGGGDCEGTPPRPFLVRKTLKSYGLREVHSVVQEKVELLQERTMGRRTPCRGLLAHVSSPKKEGCEEV